MQHIERVWHYLFVEPFTWLFYCFFQPTKFKREFEAKGVSKAHLLMVRLILPMFLISYITTIIVEMVFYIIFMMIDFGYYSPPNEVTLVLTTAPLTASGVVLGLGFGLLVGLGRLESIVLGFVVGLSEAMLIGIGLGFARNIVLDLLNGIEFSLIQGIVSGLIMGIVLGLSLGLGSGLAFGIIGDIHKGLWRAVRKSFVVSLGFCLIMSLAEGIISGVASGFTVGLVLGLLSSVASSLTLVISHIFGYYRLLFYPVSSLSGLRAYLASQRDPSQLLTYMHRSSLYWDERILLPLPCLNSMLIIAVELDFKKALEEITFIIAERPRQMNSVRAALLEIFIHFLNSCENLQDIAQIPPQLTKFWLNESEVIDRLLAVPLYELNEVVQKVVLYFNSDSWEEKRNKLKDIVEILENEDFNVVFRDVKLNINLGNGVNKWRDIARDEQKKLEKILKNKSKIDNPYNTGPVLKQGDSLFVGRRDLVQQLEQALSKGVHHPTFLLNGEKRMGKSSTLRQLPYMLDTRYLPIVYDLQRPGIISSIVNFLSAIAQEINKVINVEGNLKTKSDYVHPLEVGENEAEVYYYFDKWLRYLEDALVQENRIMLLIFDEFEKLAEAKKYLDLRLLLDWFNEVIKNRPQLALLFCGTQTLGEMSTETGINWANYFVNVQTLKISFLKPAEAHQLITQPIPDSANKYIFDEEVVKEIMRVTGCHPFLVQAVCSELIDDLNAEIRLSAEVEDVKIAMYQALENWGDTYFRDLLDRTDDNQRACLLAVKRGGKCDVHEIVRRSGIDEKSIRNTLQTLLRRDLVQLDNSIYHISALIFEEWVERNI